MLSRSFIKILGIILLSLSSPVLLLSAPLLLDDFNKEQVSNWSVWADPTSETPQLKIVSAAAEGTGALQITFPRSGKVALVAHHRLNIPEDCEVLSFWLKIIEGNAPCVIQLQEDQNRCPEGRDVFAFSLPVPPQGEWRQYKIPIKDFSYSFSQFGQGNRQLEINKIFTLGFMSQKHDSPFIIQIDKVEFLPADRQADAGKAAESKNLLTGDTSFESGAGDWLHILSPMPPQVDETDGAIGQKSIKLDANMAVFNICDKEILQKNVKYTLSFYAKSTEGAGALSCVLYTNRWQKQGQQNVTISEQWQRFAFTVTASATSGTLVAFENHQNRSVKIDAVQLECGTQMTGYESPAPLHLYASINEPGEIAVQSDITPVTLNIAVFNPGVMVDCQPLNLQYTICQYNGRVLLNGQESLTIKAGQSWNKKIPVQVGNLPGYYPVTITLKDRNGKVLKQYESPFIVAPPFSKTRDPGSFFGQHPDILPLEALHRIGVKWLRWWGPFWINFETKPGEFTQYKPTDLNQYGMEWLFWFGDLTKPPAWAKNNFGLISEGKYLSGYYKEAIRTSDHLVSAYDFQNEPDLTMSFDKQGNKIPAQESIRSYVDAIKTAHPIIHAAGKKLLLNVSGEGSDFAAEVFKSAPDAFDVYAVHPYSNQRYLGPMAGFISGPEHSDLRNKLLNAKRLIEKHGKGQELWIGELGWAVDKREPFVSQYHQQLANYLARAHLIALSVPEVKRMIWFTANGCLEMNYYEYGSWFRRNGLKPSPAAAAYATVAALFDHAAFQKAITDDDINTYYFNNNGQEIIAIWNSGRENGEKITMSLNPEDVKVIDLTGSEQIPDSTIGKLEINITGSPYYLLLKTLTPELFAEQLKAILAEQRPMRFDVSISSLNRIQVQFANNLSLERKITVESLLIHPLKQENGWSQNVNQELSVQANGNAKMVISLDRPLPGKGCSLDMILKNSKGKTLTVTQLLPPCFPCYKLDAGKDFFTLDFASLKRSMKFNRREDVFPPDQVGWLGSDDLSMELFTGWDNQFFYFMADVTDNVHFQPYTGKDYWRGDSLQLAFDTMNDASSATPGYNSNDYEFGLFQNKDNTVFWDGTIAGKLINQSSNETRVSISRQNSKTIYRTAIPWSKLKLTSEAGMIFGFSCVANDNDGGGRNFWIGIPGIAPLKQPAYFRKLLLTE